jgi:hypothetical protein
MKIRKCYNLAIIFIVLFSQISNAQDTIAPIVNSAYATSLNNIYVVFSEAVDNSGEDSSNYSLVSGKPINTATRNATLDTVTLTLSIPLSPGIHDTLYIQNIRDTSANNNIMPNAVAFPIVFGILPDTSGPIIISAYALNDSIIILNFDKDLDITTAENTSNYSGISGIASAQVNLMNQKQVILSLSIKLQSGNTYNLIIDKLKDSNGYTMDNPQSRQIYFKKPFSFFLQDNQLYISKNTTLFVDGDVEIDLGTLSNQGDINTTGHFANNFGLITGNGVYVFSGKDSATIRSKLTDTFNTVVIDKSNSNIFIELDGSILIDTLKFLSFNQIFTGSDTVIIVNPDTNAIQGHGNFKYVRGYLSRKIALFQDSLLQTLAVWQDTSIYSLWVDGISPDSVRYMTDTSWAYTFNPADTSLDSTALNSFTITLYQDSTIYPFQASSSFTAWPVYYRYTFDTLSGNKIDSYLVTPYLLIYNDSFGHIISGYSGQYVDKYYSAYDFPVGDDLYRNARIEIDTMHGIDYITASFKRGTTYNNKLYIPGYDSLHPAGTWLLSSDKQGDTISYSLNLSLNGFWDLVDNYFGIVQKADTATSQTAWTDPGILPDENQFGRLISDAYARKSNMNQLYRTESGIGVIKKGTPISVKALLGGRPYDPIGKAMQIATVFQDTLKYNVNEHPYNRPPWNYAGTDSFPNGTLPDPTVIDWVLITLRSGTTVNTAFDTIACLLRADGNIVSAEDGDTIVMMNPSPFDSFYIVVQHRNHLAVMSSVKIGPDANGVYRHSFLESQNKAYNALYNGTAMQEIQTGGPYALFGANGSGANGYPDLNVNSTDKNYWFNNFPGIGYSDADYTLDLNINSNDKNLWFTLQPQVCQVPF